MDDVEIVGRDHSFASDAGRSVAFCGAISDPDKGLRHSRCRSQPVPRRSLKRERDERPVYIADGVTNLRIEVRHECGDLGWRYVRNVDCLRDLQSASMDAAKNLGELGPNSFP
jgi:hypothetical protein